MRYNTLMLRALLLLPLFLLAACQPPPAANVAGFMLAQRLHSLPSPTVHQPPGALEGRVLAGDLPLAGAVVLVAERTGQAHTATSDAAGRYRIENIPADDYVVAAVAPGYVESALQNVWGGPAPMRVRSGQTTPAPDLQLSPLQEDMAAPDPSTLNLRLTAEYTATAPFPAGSAANVRAFAFDRAGVTVDTLRLYLPLDARPGDRYPLVLFVAPTAIDDWQYVSTAFASQGLAVVGISPVVARGVDADAQADDTRAALALAQAGALGPEVGDNRPVALGGSYSSAILARLLRTAGDKLGGWVSVGGLADAFAGAADFYAGKLQMPPNYALLVPAFGLPNLYPLTFLRYSPVFVASELPPTLIVHTAADHVLPIEQAYELERAAKAAGVPVETYYYSDTSHYLGIGDNLTDAGREMFYKIVEFVKRYGEG
ncbi:MAG: carboxypeptidase regulatory-like domain-containing protein [Caldilineaceae bacterium]